MSPRARTRCRGWRSTASTSKPASLRCPSALTYRHRPSPNSSSSSCTRSKRARRFELSPARPGGGNTKMWKGFQKPKRLAAELETLTDKYGAFSAQPFERGWATTVGNALRRALLSSIEGAAITAVKIEGVLHEFSSIPGVVTSAMIEEDADFAVLDKTVYIATVSEGGKLPLEMRVKNGRGYVSADRNFDEDLPLGYIPVDSVHSPVRKVNYSVEAARLGQMTDYEKLALEVWTNG